MCYKCICSIVPSDVLSELAKRGSEASKKTLIDVDRIRNKRVSVLNGLLAGIEKHGHGARFVYDSQHTSMQRVKLVMNENGTVTTKDKAAVDAFKLSGYVRDYFKNTFNLDSIDGKGMDIISNVHYRNNYNNAFWDGDEMTYGDGDNHLFKSFSSSVDVVAHELTHGITQFFANLDYYSQSGALNEHFSDVFGTVIKQKYKKQNIETADWLIGDEIVTDAFPGKALRSMKAPGTANDYDSQPDHMDNYYAGPDDNQGVHINSGIPNKAFYLCCMELGVDTCALIWFEALKKLWRYAKFTDMVEVLMACADELANKGDVPANAAKTIQKSFDKVGVVLTMVA